MTRNRVFFLAFALLFSKILHAGTPQEDMIAAIRNDDIGAVVSILKNRKDGLDFSAGFDIPFIDEGEAETLRGNLLGLATLGGNKRIISALITHGANPKEGPNGGFPPLIFAIRKDRETIKFLVKKGADIDLILNGKTLLHETVLNSSKKEVDFLIRLGANVNAPGELGFTALHHAAMNGDQRMVEHLILKGAKVGAKANDGSTPLHFAGARASVGSVDLLIQKGAQAGQKNNDGITPLHVATQFGSVAVAERLIQKGANVNAVASNQFTPLMFAVTGNSEEMVDLLIRSGANVNQPSHSGFTPLHQAAVRGDSGILKLLLKKRADVNSKSAHGLTPVLLAHYVGHPELIKPLRDSPRFDFKVNILSALQARDQALATDLLSIAKEKIPGFSVDSRAVSSTSADPCVPKHGIPDNIQTLLSLFGKQDCSICMEVCGGTTRRTRVDGSKVEVQKSPPVLAACGHLFCKDCLQRWQPESPTKPCPTCRKPLLPTNILDSSVLNPE